MKGKFLAAFFDGLCGAVKCKRPSLAALYEAGPDLGLCRAVD